MSTASPGSMNAGLKKPVSSLMKSLDGSFLNVTVSPCVMLIMFGERIPPGPMSTIISSNSVMFSSITVTSTVALSKLLRPSVMVYSNESIPVTPKAGSGV